MAGDIKYGNFVKDLMKAEGEWRDRYLPKDSNDRSTNITIEKIEATFTSSNPLYQIANAEMTESWLKDADMPVSSLYELPAGEIIIPADDPVKTLEQKLDTFISDEDSDTGNPFNS